MAERRQLRELFERDLHEIAVPPQSDWFPTVPAERAIPRWLLATTAVAAIIVALVFGSYIYSRLPGKPGGVVAPPTPSPTLYEVSGRVTDAATGEALPGVRVYLETIGGTCCTYFAAQVSGLSDASGAYRVQVQKGNYRVLFMTARSGQPPVCLPPCTDPVAPEPYAALWWPNGVGMAQADYLTVDTDRGGIDGALRRSHEIVGSFTYGGGPARAFIIVQRAREGDLVAIAATNEDGTFRVAVSDGVYYIEFAPFDPGPMGGAWPKDIVVQGADVVGIDRVEP